MKTFEAFKKSIMEDGEGTVGVSVNPTPGGPTETTNSVINPNNQMLSKKKIIKRSAPKLV